MNKYFISTICGLLFVSLAFTSCDTPTGQGAGWGAATGAIIGGAATGRVRGAAIGAGIGAATGALLGAAVEEDQYGYYGGRPASYYPYARPAGRRGFYHSPYTGNVYDLRGVPHGGLTRDFETGQLFRRP
jgi:outer membrane protein with glycine zipper